DLAIAAAVVNAAGDRPLPSDAAWLGELALDGAVRPIRGTLAITAHLDQLGVRHFYVPTANVAEARIATTAPVLGVGHLRDLKAHWEAGAPLVEAPSSRPDAAPAAPLPVDLADVRGQPHAKRALEVAAAGALHPGRRGQSVRLRFCRRPKTILRVHPARAAAISGAALRAHSRSDRPAGYGAAAGRGRVVARRGRRRRQRHRTGARHPGSG